MARKKTKAPPVDAEDTPASQADRLTADGAEIHDPVPLAVTVGFTAHPPTLHDQVQALFRAEEFRRAAAFSGLESFDEANDFDVDDDPELRTQYELDAFEGERPPEYVDPLHPSMRSREHWPTKQSAPPPPPPAPAPPAPQNESTLPPTPPGSETKKP